MGEISRFLLFCGDDRATETHDDDDGG